MVLTLWCTKYYSTYSNINSMFLSLCITLHLGELHHWPLMVTQNQNPSPVSGRIKNLQEITATKNAALKNTEKPLSQLVSSTSEQINLQDVKSKLKSGHLTGQATDFIWVCNMFFIVLCGVLF